MLLSLLLPIFALTAVSRCETTTEANLSEEDTTQANITALPSLLDATASKLIRYRTKAPVTYYRYKNQPFKRPRPRVKIPQAKYGPPVYTISEPPSYYKKKPEIHTSTQSYKPSYSYDEVHYEVSSEYPILESIPLSDYESQSMDVDFYGETYSKKKTPQFEYAKPQKSSAGRGPLKSYGLPKETTYNSYDTYSEDDYKTQSKQQPEIHYEVSYHEELPTKVYESPPRQKYGPPPAPLKEEYDQFPPYSPPFKSAHQPEQESYQVPNQKYEAPVSSYHPNEQPSTNSGPYPLYEKKVPNAGYSYNNHFAEPPTNFHYTYSPSYEISLIPKKQEKPDNAYGPPPGTKYGPPSETYGPPSDTYGPPSNTYGPPSDSHIPPSHSYAPPSDTYGPPSDAYAPQSNRYAPPSKDSYAPPPAYTQEPHGQHKAPTDSYHQPSGGGQFAEPPGSYLPPAHHPDELPLTKNHMPPGYDYPKSSYEVPLYDPVPFESTTPGQDYFPPHYNSRPPPMSEHTSESNNHVQQFPLPAHRPNPSTFATTITSTTINDHEPVPEANSKVHRFTPQDHRSNNVNRYETSSKFAVKNEESESEEPSSKYLDKIVSTTSTFRSRRKRKRTKAPATVPHNLDTPELKEAFETGHDQSEEPPAHVSNIKENVSPSKQEIDVVSPVRLLADFSPSHSWNPIRTRPKQANPTRGPRIPESTLNELKNVEVLSIEKSRSHSYYAGTVPTTRTRNFSSRVGAPKKSTVPTTAFTVEDVSLPTRRLPVDKTYFKTRDNEEDYMYDGTGDLPKNHKLF